MNSGTSESEISRGPQYAGTVLFGVCLILCLLFWQNNLFFPVKLFVVLIHEVSHGLAALFSGGTIEEIQVTLQLGGSCVAQGGNTLLTALSGYAGSLIIGALLYLSSQNGIFRRYVLVSISAMLLIMMSAYVKSSFGIISVLSVVAFFLLLPWFLPDTASYYFVKTTGILSLIYSVVDIKHDMLSSSLEFSDAQLMASQTGISAYFWGMIVFFVSVAICILLIRREWKTNIQVD